MTTRSIQRQTYRHLLQPAQTDRRTDRQKANSAARRDSTGEATWIAWQANWLLNSNPSERLFAHFLTFAYFLHFLHSVQKIKEFKESDICPSVCCRFNTRHKFQLNTAYEVQAENRQKPSILVTVFVFSKSSWCRRLQLRSAALIAMLLSLFVFYKTKFPDISSPLVTRQRAIIILKNSRLWAPLGRC